MRQWLDRLNPTRQLPKPMRRYLAMPNWLFLAWLVVSALVLAVGLPGQPQTPPPEAADGLPAPSAAAPPPAQAAPRIAANIAVSGSQTFTILDKDGKLFVTALGQPALVLAGDADGLRVETVAGDLVYRLKLKDGEQGKVYDAAGSLRYRLKCEDEEGGETCKLYDGQAGLLNRFKVKQDSFNVYGPDAQRLYKGKLKNGEHVLKTEADGAVLAIRGASTLKAAALLALPVEIPIRALLWRHAGF